MNSLRGTKVIVGLSGGVDSAVAALLLREQGCQVTAVFMQNWEDDDEHCTIRQDYRDAAGVCARLNIPLQSVNFAEEYWQRVFQHFLDEYSAGRTPNPDILCNREIKFRAFLDYALAQGSECIATGHYARLQPGPSGTEMLRAQDASKDQSYFLYTLGQPQLTHTLFPVGDLTKDEVRRMARDAGLQVHAKKDSTGICFIGERKFRSFLSEYLTATPGPIFSEYGVELGRHQGLMYYTIGQRQGLGIGGLEGASDQPWYVLNKDVTGNRLIVGQGHDHPALYHTGLSASDLTWVAGEPPAQSFACSAKVRYRQIDQSAIAKVSTDGTQLNLRFDDPVWGITPGQSVVLYNGPCCLGGAVIDAAVENPRPTPRSILAGGHSTSDILLPP